MTVLTDDTVLAASQLLGVQTLPLVLAVTPRQDDVESFTAARVAALAALRDNGLVDSYGDLAPDLAVRRLFIDGAEAQLA